MGLISLLCKPAVVDADIMLVTCTLDVTFGVVDIAIAVVPAIVVMLLALAARSLYALYRKLEAVAACCGQLRAKPHRCLGMYGNSNNSRGCRQDALMLACTRGVDAEGKRHCTGLEASLRCCGCSHA